MSNAEKDTLIIGGAGGAWGDSSFGVTQLLDEGRCDFIIFEALAEITMGLLTRAHRRNSALGYTPDVIRMIGDEITRIHEQGVRIVTNAGGVNPRAAAVALREMADAAGVKLRIGVVQGDDLREAMPTLRESGLTEMHTGTPLPEDVLSFNAYLGARPIAAALDAGADVVITGRVVDSALVLGPLISHFGWGEDDLDRLSQGSLCGHLLECGPQSTGGLLTDWEDVDDWEGIGFPLAECAADGAFVVTKPAGSGGLVDARSVSEQLLYEIGDPAAYLLPDVRCDWRFVELDEVGPDRVRVTGARGLPRPATLKACAQLQDGYKVSSLLFIGGRDAAKKGAKLGREALRRVDRTLRRGGFAPLRASDVEVLGAEATYGPHSRAAASREVVVKLTMTHDTREALSEAVKEIPSFALVLAGMSGGGAGRPKPSPIIRLESFLVEREHIRPTVALDGAPVAFEPLGAPSGPGEPSPLPKLEASPPEAPTRAVPLVAIAHGRSGDKGPHANIGVRARHPDFLPLLRATLTEVRVAEHFAHRLARPEASSVRRYELPTLDALNFMLDDALGGGGIASLRFDPQGKAYAQQLLDMLIEVPEAWLSHPGFRSPNELHGARDATHLSGLI